MVATLRLLPCNHVTDGYSFRDVVRSSTLRTSNCRHFGEDLLYFFYGRPAYRSRESVEPTKDLGLHPCCFIMRLAAIEPLRRVFPFDSGAFHAGIYLGKINERLPIQNFAIESSVASIMDFVNKYYDSNEAYWRAKPKNMSIDPLDFEASTIAHLLSSPEAKYDDRASCIELQVDHDVAIDAGGLLGIVVPTDFLDAPEVQLLVSRTGCLTETYDVFRVSPIEDMGALRQATKYLLRKAGYL